MFSLVRLGSTETLMDWNGLFAMTLEWERPNFGCGATMVCDKSEGGHIYTGTLLITEP